MINISDSSIKKQISDEAATLACSKYFLGCPRPHLTKAKEAKIAEGNLATYFIGGISAGVPFIWGFFAEDASVGGAFVGARLCDTSC